MIIKALILALQITTIYVVFQQGMLLGWLRIWMANKFDEILGKKWSRYVQKPLWDCLTCMCGLWTIILTASFDIGFIFTVGGMLAIIDKYLDDIDFFRRCDVR